MENNFKKPLATVAGKAIYDSDVDEAIAAMGQRGAAYQQNPQGRAMILEQLIEQRLFLADAMRNVYEREPEFKAQILASLVRDIWPKVESGEVRATVYKVLPMSEAEAAHDLLQSGTSAGKVVLRVAE